jgi:hypothetical protein
MLHSAVRGLEDRAGNGAAVDALTSPLLRAPPLHAFDISATDAEVSTLVALARDRGAHDIVIGSGRTSAAAATMHSIRAAWARVGGHTLAAITWTETGASWLRQATRFAATDADLWVMTGPATGWAQMTRRLLWSTSWTPAHTLATAGIGEPRTLALVGVHNLDGLAGAYRDGGSWTITNDAVATSGGHGTR